MVTAEVTEGQAHRQRDKAFHSRGFSIPPRPISARNAEPSAKAGDPWVISGYLGKGDDFDEAMGKYALAYADQAEQDHAALNAAVRAGIAS